ncbi:hypothetical protein FA13DRAFT_1764259 [Coprinellus micaceus]|uniref:G-protein coupled receptors family 2 profile 2 domain-containing protein n=1 Tax=Coprinellus micaceus TaxID=71717 RepID=A0A4Y7TA59_COPMI|nr:hypothetical protein FA13DRAFT_1764259 [Coprinellus micaceus]
MQTSLVRAFLALHLMSIFLFALTMFSAILFRSVKRCPMWYSFCASWLMFSASFSLLAFAGQQFSLTQSKNLCIAQAGLVYAAPFLAGCASAALVIKLLSNILDTVSPNLTRPNRTSLVGTILGLAVPWGVWLGVLIGVLIFSVTKQGNVSLSPNATFCVVQSSPVPRLTSVFTIILAVVVLSLELVIATFLIRHRSLKDLLSQSKAVAVRVFLFTGVVLTAAVTGLAFAMTDRRGGAFDVLMAMTPFCTALIFGSQSDLWKGYVQWLPASCLAKRTHHEVAPSHQETISIRQGTIVIS